MKWDKIGHELLVVKLKTKACNFFLNALFYICCIYKMVQLKYLGIHILIEWAFEKNKYEKGLTKPNT